MRLKPLALGLLACSICTATLAAGGNPFMRPGQAVQSPAEAAPKSVFSSGSAAAAAVVKTEAESLAPAQPAPAAASAQAPAPVAPPVKAALPAPVKAETLRLPAKGLPVIPPPLPPAPKLPPVIPAPGAAASVNTVVNQPAPEAQPANASPAKATAAAKAAADAARARMATRKAQCHPALTSEPEVSVAAKGASTQVTFKQLAGCVDGVSVFDETGAAITWLTIQRVAKDSVHLLAEENSSGQGRRASVSVITPNESFLLTVAQPATAP